LEEIVSEVLRQGVGGKLRQAGYSFQEAGIAGRGVRSFTAESMVGQGRALIRGANLKG
jgi:hypothetical protein